MEYKTMKQCIKEKYDTLSMQEKKVAKYIIDIAWLCLAETKSIDGTFCSPLRSWPSSLA